MTARSIDLTDEDRALIRAAAERAERARQALANEVLRHERVKRELMAAIQRSDDQVEAVGQALAQKYLGTEELHQWTLMADEARLVYNAEGETEP